jgi:hypothetical protein
MWGSATGDGWVTGRRACQLLTSRIERSARLMVLEWLTGKTLKADLVERRGLGGARRSK